MLKYTWLSLLVILLDQLSKQLATSMLQLHTPVAVLPSFSLTLMHNTGAAFSFLSQAGGWQRWFFTALALIISVVLLRWLTQLKTHEHGLAIALSLVLGGAIGNVWDRILYGHVIDFIDIHYRNWHWPAFNIADSAITVGAVLLLLLSLRDTKTATRK